MSILFSESFTGADANPIGGHWTTITGLAALQRISNSVDGTSGDSGAYVNTVSPPDDQYATATFSGSAITTDAGPICRSAGSAVTHYLLDIATNMQLYRVVAGSYTAIGSAAGFTLLAGQTVTLKCIGTAISGWWSGSGQLVSATDGSIGSGKFGYFSSGVSQRYTAFEAGDFLSGVPDNQLYYVQG